MKKFTRTEPNKTQFNTCQTRHRILRSAHTKTCDDVNPKWKAIKKTHATQWIRRAKITPHTALSLSIHHTHTYRQNTYQHPSITQNMHIKAELCGWYAIQQIQPNIQPKTRESEWNILHLGVYKFQWNGNDVDDEDDIDDEDEYIGRAGGKKIKKKNEKKQMCTCAVCSGHRQCAWFLVDISIAYDLFVFDFRLFFSLVRILLRFDHAIIVRSVVLFRSCDIDKQIKCNWKSKMPRHPLNHSSNRFAS